MPDGSNCHSVSQVSAHPSTTRAPAHADPIEAGVEATTPALEARSRQLRRTSKLWPYTGLIGIRDTSARTVFCELSLAIFALDDFFDDPSASLSTKRDGARTVLGALASWDPRVPAVAAMLPVRDVAGVAQLARTHFAALVRGFVEEAELLEQGGAAQARTLELGRDTIGTAVVFTAALGCISSSTVCGDEFQGALKLLSCANRLANDRKPESTKVGADLGRSGRDAREELRFTVEALRAARHIPHAVVREVVVRHALLLPVFYALADF